MTKDLAHEARGGLWRSSGASNRLVILAKAPVAGRSKTRLAAEVGAGRAAMIARFLTDRTLDVATTGERCGWWRASLAVDPPHAVGARWPGRRRGVPTFAQSRGDLGDRILHAMRSAPGRGPVAAIGADAPALSCAAIRRAFLTLRSNDVVFGPTHDGGFWFIGVAAARILPKEFEGVRWSSEHALADARAAFGGRRRIALADALLDIDVADDLATAGRFALGRTDMTGSVFGASPETSSANEADSEVVPIAEATFAKGRRRLARLFERFRAPTSAASAG